MLGLVFGSAFSPERTIKRLNGIGNIRPMIWIVLLATVFVYIVTEKVIEFLAVTNPDSSSKTVGMPTTLVEALALAVGVSLVAIPMLLRYPVAKFLCCKIFGYTSEVREVERAIFMNFSFGFLLAAPILLADAFIKHKAPEMFVYFIAIQLFFGFSVSTLFFNRLLSGGFFRIAAQNLVALIAELLVVVAASSGLGLVALAIAGAWILPK